jgi:hypothetical protein
MDMASLFLTRMTNLDSSSLKEKFVNPVTLSLGWERVI